MRSSGSLLAVLAAIPLIGLSCIFPTGPDVDAVAADERELVITYAPGDSAASVTGNVVLPASGPNGSSVSWSSDNESRITIEGIVTRPAGSSGHASVRLTATISKGKASAEKVFALTVKDESFTGNTMNAGTVTDIDGNIYWAVKIGDQVWTVDNLRTTRYSDGTAIPYVNDSSAWVNLATPGYCYFNDIVDADRVRKFGMLYNWYAVDTKMLAPAGWHIPTDGEWDILQNYLIANGYNWDATTEGNKIAKSLAARTDWDEGTGLTAGSIGNDLTKNNRSGFLALPGGSRTPDGNYDFGGSGTWWSATEYNASGAVARNLYSTSDSLSWNSNYKSCAFSVRLVRD